MLRNRDRLLRLLVFCAMVIAAPLRASAYGLGAYFEYSRGEQHIDYDVIEEDFSNDRFGGGIVYDSNVARDAWLNLRGSVGYVHTRNTVDDEAHGAALDLSAGYGFFRTRDFRLWVAPAVRIGVDVYESKVSDVIDFAVGGGARLGLNWHLTPQISLAPSIAFQYLYVRETIDDDLGNDRYDGHERLVTVRLSVLFRDVEDVFRSAARGALTPSSD